MYESQEPHSSTSLLPPHTDLKHDTCNHSNLNSDTYESDPAEIKHACVDLDAVPDWASSDDSVSPMRNQRTRILVDIYDAPHALSTTDPIMPMHACMIQASDPQTYPEAIGNPLWQATMDEEYNSLIENQTWDLVPLPPRYKLVRCKWFYRTKKSADGHERRYKARLVAKAFQQVHGIDYDETFALVAKNGLYSIGSCNCSNKKVGDLSHGCEEWISSW